MSVLFVVDPADEGRGWRVLGSCVAKGSLNRLLIPLVRGAFLLLSFPRIPSGLIPGVRIFSWPFSPVVVCVASFSPPFWPVSLPSFSWPCVSPPLVSRVGVKKPVIPVVVRVGVETRLVPPILILRGVPRIQGGSVGFSLEERPSGLLLSCGFGFISRPVRGRGFLPVFLLGFLLVLVGVLLGLQRLWCDLSLSFSFRF